MVYLVGRKLRSLLTLNAYLCVFCHILSNIILSNIIVSDVHTQYQHVSAWSYQI